jgi:methionine-R-sulfoxide reductase
MENGTEAAHSGEYANTKAEGVYFSIASGSPLFSSKDKFDSGTGWPSFRKVIEGSNVMEITDSSHGMTRTEVRSGDDDIHLGHLFKEWGGNRYCINSASLKFVKKEDLTQE